MTKRRNREPKKILSHYIDANGERISKDEYTKLFTEWKQRDKELQEEKIDKIEQIKKLKGKLAKLKDKYEVELLLDEMNISDEEDIIIGNKKKKETAISVIRKYCIDKKLEKGEHVPYENILEIRKILKDKGLIKAKEWEKSIRKQLSNEGFAKKHGSI